MATANRTRRITLLLVVLGILVALGAMLTVGLIVGDDSDGIDPHQGQVTVPLLR